MRFGNCAVFMAALVWMLGLAPLAACAQSVDVLWYTYAHPRSIYMETVRKIADLVHTLPKSGGLKWKVTFFGPQSPAPDFAKYNVLVVQSGEAFYTGQYFKGSSRNRVGDFGSF